ncbi:MAG: YdcF family protein [Parcubacteria group bacterium]|nr:YdcF family protein [Parcubacteria group bacterium]
MWQCFFCWDAGSSKLCWHSAQAIIALSFGVGDRCQSNQALADTALSLFEHFSLPLLLQGEVADSLPSGTNIALVVRKHRIPGVYLDTREVLEQVAKFAESRGWSRVIIVAHPDHVWRARLAAERLGFEVFVADTQGVPYDRNSLQPWTRSKRRFVPREILARVFYLLRGWI